MANNVVMRPGYRQSVACSQPAAPAAGAAVLYGMLTGVALTTEDAAGLTSVDFGPAVYLLSVQDGVGGGIAIGNPLFLNAAATQVSNVATGFYFGAALAIVGGGLTANINVLHLPSPGAGTLGAGTINTAHLAVGILSANAAGRALFAAGVLDTATVLAAFAAGSLTEANLLSLIPADAITNAVLLDAVLNGAFQADAGTRALFADAIWTEAKLAVNSLTGLVAANVANANVIGGIPVLHRVNIADASADTDVVLTHKTLITDFWFVNTGVAAHAATDTIQLKNVANAITDAIAKTATVNAIKRASTMDSAQTTIAAGAIMRITAVKGLNAAVTAYVLGVRVA